MIKIKIFSGWCSSTEAKQRYENICNSELIKNYRKTFVLTDQNDYTHAILFNRPTPTLNIPKENVVGLAHEPIIFLGIDQGFIEYTKKYLGKYLIGDIGKLPSPFIEQYSFVYHNPPLKYIPIKTKLMSIIFSKKRNIIGQKYRHNLVENIIKTSIPIDIYGRGCSLYNYKDKRIKGCFTEWEPYLDYKFHICIENCRSNNIFSEKVVNPMLADSTPIYLGCYNIDNYFPNHIITLTGDIESDIDLLYKISINPDKYIKKINLELVDDKINLLKNIPKLFSFE